MVMLDHIILHEFVWDECLYISHHLFELFKVDTGMLFYNSLVTFFNAVSNEDKECSQYLCHLFIQVLVIYFTHRHHVEDFWLESFNSYFLGIIIDNLFNPVMLLIKHFIEIEIFSSGKCFLGFFCVIKDVLQATDIRFW